MYGARWYAGAGRGGGRVCPSCCPSGIRSVASALEPPVPVGVALICAHRTICARAVKRLDENQEVIISNACAGPSQPRLEIR